MHLILLLIYTIHLSQLSQSDATRRPYAVRCIQATLPAHRPPRPSPTIPRQPVLLRYLRKFLPFSNSVLPVRNDQPRDPLDVCLYLSSFSDDFIIAHSVLLHCLPPSFPRRRSQLRGIQMRTWVSTLVFTIIHSCSISLDVH